MAKTAVQPQLAQSGTWEQTFRDGTRELLRASAQWPQLEAQCPGSRRINRYYTHLFAQWRRRWEGPLLSRAKAQDTEGKSWSASLSYEVTLLTPTLFSLWWEAAEEVGEGRPRRVRQGDIWAIPQGTPIGPRVFFAPLGRGWKKTVLEAVEDQIQSRLQTGEFLFKENWSQALRQYFSEEGFFLTPEGPMLLYPADTIAPTLEGFPTFSLASLLPEEIPEPDMPQKET